MSRLAHPPSLALLLVTSVCACGNDAAPSNASGPGVTAPATTTRDCAAPFVAGDAGCDLVRPTCPAGKKPKLDGTCEVVGNAQCAKGFEAHGSGWGCEPVLATGSCVGASRAAVGAAACVSVGACAWPLATAADVIVDAAAAEDAAHAHTIAGALAKVAPNGTIAVAPGSYVEHVVVDKPVTISGACAKDVVIEGPTADAPAFDVKSTATSFHVSGMTLRGHRNALALASNVEAVADALVLEDNVESGIHVGSAASLTLRTSVVRGGRVRPDDATRGNGIVVEATGFAGVEDSALEDNAEGALRLEGAAKARLEDVVIRGTKPLDTGRGGFAIMSLGAFDVSVKRSVFVGNAEAGLLAEPYQGNSSRVSKVLVEDSYIADTAPWKSVLSGVDNYAGWNVLSRGAQVTLRRSTLRRGAAPVLALEGGGLEIDQSTITEPADSKGGAADLVVCQGADLTMKRTAVIGLRRGGVVVYQKAKGLVEDTLIADANAAVATSSAAGIQAAGGAEVDVRNTAVVDYSAYGIRVGGLAGKPAPTKVTVTDSIVSTGHGYATGGFGEGVEVNEGELLMRGSLIERAQENALLVEAKATLERSVIRGTTSRKDGRAGRGIHAQYGGQVVVVDSILRDNRDASAFAYAAGSKLRFERTLIERSLPNGRDVLGHGVVAVDGAVLELLDTSVRDSAAVAIVAWKSRGFVRGGEVRSNAVGVHVAGGTTLLNDAADPEENELHVSPETQFVGNTTRVGGGEVPLPELDP